MTRTGSRLPVFVGVVLLVGDNLDKKPWFVKAIRHLTGDSKYVARHFTIWILICHFEAVDELQMARESTQMKRGI